MEYFMCKNFEKNKEKYAKFWPGVVQNFAEKYPRYLELHRILWHTGRRTDWTIWERSGVHLQAEVERSNGTLERPAAISKRKYMHKKQRQVKAVTTA